jgi:hypothetical protein
VWGVTKIGTTEIEVQTKSYLVLKVKFPSRRAVMQPKRAPWNVQGVQFEENLAMQMVIQPKRHFFNKYSSLIY